MGRRGWSGRGLGSDVEDEEEERDEGGDRGPGSSSAPFHEARPTAIPEIRGAGDAIINPSN